MVVSGLRSAREIGKSLRREHLRQLPRFAPRRIPQIERNPRHALIGKEAGDRLVTPGPVAAQAYDTCLVEGRARRLAFYRDAFIDLAGHAPIGREPDEDRAARSARLRQCCLREGFGIEQAFGS